MSYSFLGPGSEFWKIYNSMKLVDNSIQAIVK